MKLVLKPELKMQAGNPGPHLLKNTNFNENLGCPVAAAVSV